MLADAPPGPATPKPTRWLAVLRRYVIGTLFGNLVWESVQLPLYRIWHHATAVRLMMIVGFGVCGDVLIAINALVFALVAFGAAAWPAQAYRRVGVATVLIGVVYTIASEYVHVTVLGTWHYARAMPTLPILHVGFVPVLQWIVVPGAVLVWSARMAGRG